MSEEKKGLLEAIRLGREIKESVPAGSEYLNAKAAVQFYKGVLKDLEQREAAARKRLDELRESPRTFEIGETEITIPLGEDMDALLREVALLQETLKAGWEIAATRKGQETVKDLMRWEDNHSNKVGIDEVRRRLLENDMLTAAALQERG